MKPTVSVIIPTYNRAKYIRKAIQSVLNQKLPTGHEMEVIVVDDGSTDDTAEIVNRIGHPVAYYKLPHSGLPAVARNFGLTKAKADLIAFQDSDDLWAAGKLKEQLPVFEDPATVLCYGNGMLMEADGKLTKQLIVPYSHQKSGDIFADLIAENFISTLTVVARKDILEKLGGFNESMRLRGLEDYELWLRLTGLNLGKVRAIKKPLAYYRRHEQNVSLASHNYPLENIIFVLDSMWQNYASQLSFENRSHLEATLQSFKKIFRNYINNSTPLVSVVMSVYNAGEFLEEAIQSILDQNYTNFEFIIVDDGSKDDSWKVIKSFSDKRIKAFHQSNQGLQASLNFGISKATGRYVARMDQDDISAPERLEKQVRFLEKNSQLAIVGSSFSMIDEYGLFFSRSCHLNRTEDLKLEIFTRNPFGHGTVMLRRQVLEEVSGYDIDEPVEDYDLWRRILKKYDGTNLTRDLYSWRVIPTSMSHRGSEERQDLIHSLLTKIWHNNPLANVPMSQIKSGLDHYRKIDDEHLEQYKFMVSALCMGAFKMRRYIFALNLLIKLLLSDLTIVKSMYRLMRQPFSHNYLLGLIYKD